LGKPLNEKSFSTKRSGAAKTGKAVEIVKVVEHLEHAAGV
jgi:hypothetical protein